MRIDAKDIHLLKMLSPEQVKALKRDIVETKEICAAKLQDAYYLQTGKKITLSDDPQTQLTVALKNKLGEKVESEKEGLIKGRKFRADIYLRESNLVIEFDGYEFHKSLDAFKNDRIKRNLLVQNGYPVMSFFYKQIQDDLESVVNQIIDTHNYFINVFVNRKS